MGQAASQKERERAFLEKFRSCYEDFPVGEVIDSESPDFIIENGQACTGIEVTEFYSQLRDDEPTPAQARESRRIKVLRLVEEECEANGLLNFQVIAVFHPGRNLEPRKESDFVRRLAQLIKSNLPSPGVEIRLLSTPKNCGSFPEEIGSVWISQPLDSSEQNYVRCTWGGVSPKYTLPELQEKIGLKEGKVPNYTGRCHQTWLLIAGGQFWRPSTWIDLPEGVDEHEFHSSFDKVFFFHDYHSKVKEFLLDYKNRTARDVPYLAL